MASYLSILMAGGGTGGHLWPGISLAQAIQSLVPHARISFLVPGKPVDRAILATTSYSWYINPMRPMPAALTRLPRFIADFMRGWAATQRTLRICRPDILVGLGGYGALSAGFLAQSLRIPLVMLESNTFAGKVVRWFSTYATAVYSNTEVDGVNAVKIKKLGIPIRSDLPYDKVLAVDSASPLHILVMGGSQGANCINDAMCEAAACLQPWRENITIVHLCGKERDKIAAAYAQNHLTATVISFSPQMAGLYRDANLVIGRAGGTTLAEIQAIGLPAILIPLAQAAEGHQLLNARRMEKSGAAVVITEDALHGDELARRISLFVQNRQQLVVMASKAKSMGKPNAAYDIARDILSVLG
jgi:UDP-N-acetylglucosamine--N-acetylmuramyl-(pentapeptide) pyrophosphoryl-undecaprenol N-acetylglucosamine transferase